MDFLTRRKGYAGLEEGRGPEFREVEEKPWYRRRGILAILVIVAIALVAAVILAIALPGSRPKQELSLILLMNNIAAAFYCWCYYLLFILL